MTTKTVMYIWISLYMVLIGCTLKNTTPYKGDESYYIASSIRMVQSDNVIVPVYFGEARFQKPLIAYWLTTLGYKTFGIDLWSGRLPFLALSCALLMLLYKFALLLVPDYEFAALNVFLLSSATLFIEYTRVSMTDMPLTFFTTLSLYFFCKALQEPERLTRYYLFAYISAGLAYSSKGFIGIFPGLAIAVYLLLTRPAHYRKYLIRLFHPGYVLLFALLAFPWYVYAYFYHFDDLMKQFAVESSATFASNLWAIPGNLVFYPGVSLTFYLPFAPIATYLFIKKRPKIPTRFVPVLCYIGTTFLIFSLLLSRHKGRYALVVFPALTLIISYILYHSPFKKSAKTIAIAVAGLHIVVFLLYPTISGHPFTDLIQYWRNNTQGNLAAYGLTRREMSWAQALSNGDLQLHHEEGDYLLTNAEHLADFESPNILKQASRLSKIRIENGTLIKRKRTYYLIAPSRAY
ncbi:hypothetical protein CSA56_04180 [candidate division KSB3 bacterium]|uniref:Glycosyltransferase RgtA/B/C/D-like domain-containing protein n=1 Tax=candidate division KSB3 bacterium TaxID=2044937 RepID=A0A2G6KIF8_9BACT|nr:MAG: hypothetical protein CSA56_04180 [candidate division KSB3 bacterium]